MIYETYLPSAQLEELVEYYWHSSIEPSELIAQFHPTPLLQGLAFNFYKKEVWHTFDEKTIRHKNKGYFFGQPVSPRLLTTNKQGMDLLCVKFRPLGIAKLTGINMKHLADSFIEAGDIWGTEFEWLCDEMQSSGSTEGSITVLEKFLFAAFLKRKQAYYLKNVSNALFLMNQSFGSQPIKEIQLQTNTTRKTLERNFIQAVGLKPKLYAQIVRFNFAKSALDQPDRYRKISDVAYTLGYFNNSHLAAEFKRFSGFTPREYIKNMPW